MILTKSIKINVTHTNIKYLISIYHNIKYLDIININVEDLTCYSTIKIDVMCDICAKELVLAYGAYMKNYKKYSFYSCKQCKTQKTQKTKFSLYGDINYNNSKKMINTKEMKGIYTPQHMSSDFKYYRKLVNRFTYKSKIQLYKNWNGIDAYDNEYIKNNFIFNSNHMEYPTVDHIISIHQGFLENIPPYIIGNIKNLCITKRQINLLKRNKHSIFK